MQRLVRALWCGLIVLFMSSSGIVRPAGAQIQLFSAVDKSVVGVGEAFTVEVEAYAVAEPSASSLRAAVEEATFAGAFDGVELVRRELVSERIDTLDTGMTVQVARWNYIWKATRRGRGEVPAMVVIWRERAQQLPGYSVTAYKIDPSFFDAGRSVLPVIADWIGAPGRPSYRRTGSAFLVAPDIAVTSLHVILDADRIYLKLPNGEQVQAGEAWVVDVVRDVALLHVDGEATRRAGLTPLTVAPTHQSVYGRRAQEEHTVAFTYGWPGGAQHSTAGVRYSGVTLHPHEELWITSNPVRPGDSGGPLLDRHGRALGVISSGTVRRGRHTMLNEALSVATDFRPALSRKALVARPQSLSKLLRDLDATERPHMQALRASTLLARQRPDPQNLKTSLAHLDEDLQTRPDHAHLLFVRGMIHQAVGAREAALASYRAAFEASDGHFLAAHMLGLSWLQQGRVGEAERMFRTVRQYPPYVQHATYGLAYAFLNSHRYDEADSLFRTVVAHNPTSAPAYFGLARCLIAQGRSVEAHLLALRLERISAIWAGRLRRVLREPVLQPISLRELPRASLSMSPGRVP